MQIICGIQGVRNTTITETIQPEQVQVLLKSCSTATEFEQRTFHVVSRKWKKEGVVVFPAGFRGLGEYWEARSEHAAMAN